MNKDEQVDIFNIFHDGYISHLTKSNEDIYGTIEIKYLAEIIDSSYSSFKCIFKSCSCFRFEVWSDTPEVIEDIDSICQLELEILDAKAEVDYIKVTCLFEGGYGGILTVLANNIVVYDEGGKEISVEELGNICDKYWRRFEIEAEDNG